MSSLLPLCRLSQKGAWLALTVLGAVACGQHPGVQPGLDDGAPSADGGAPRPDAAPGLPDAAVPLVPCDWVADETHPVTSPPNDKDVHAAVVTEHGVLVAFMSSNPDPPSDTTRRLQRLTYLGVPDGPAEALFPPPGQWSSYGSVSLAAGPEHLGAAVWDEAGRCRLRPIDGRGAVLGDWSTVDERFCGSLRSTPEGFSLLTRVSGSAGEQRLLRLASDGSRLSESEPIPALQGDVSWWASLALPDGDLLVAGMREGFDAAEVVTQRLGPDGSPRAAPISLGILEAPGRRVRLVETSEGVLAGWTEERSGAASTQAHRLVLQPLGVDGAPLGSAQRHDGAPTVYRDGSWSLVLAQGEILAAWVVPEGDAPSGDVTTLVVQPLTPEGELAGPAIPLSDGRFLRRPVLRQTPLGAIAVFTAMPESSPHQVFAAALRCERP